MKTIIIKLLQKFVFRTSLQSIIIRQHEKDLVEINRKRVTGNNFVFYPETIISNMQNNPSKIEIGENTHVRGTLLVFNYGGKIKIGANCYVGDASRIWSGDQVSIGDNVLIAHNVNIVDTQAHEINAIERSDRYLELISKGPWANKGSIETKAITIQNKAWISFNAIILKGVTIGEGAIVAAGSVVTKDVAPYTMVAGNPAVFVKNVK
jgi:acetyltransferase-like isoleucine patch superfamily enzyme